MFLHTFFTQSTLQQRNTVYSTALALRIFVTRALLFTTSYVVCASPPFTRYGVRAQLLCIWIQVILDQVARSPGPR